MLTQTFSQRGLGKLCLDFSKIAFVLLFVLAGVALQEAQGQIVIILDDLDEFTQEVAWEESKSAPSLNPEVHVSGFQELTISPNPFSSQLNIQVGSNEGLSYIELVNEFGAVVWAQNVYSVPDRFYLDPLPAGTYHLNLELAQGSYSETLQYQP